MTHPTDDKGADAVIQSEIMEARERRDQHEMFAAVLRIPFLAGVTGSSRHLSLQRAEKFDLIVEERRAAWSKPPDA